MFHVPEAGEVTVESGGEVTIVTHCICGFDVLLDGVVIRQVFNGGTNC